MKISLVAFMFFLLAGIGYADTTLFYDGFEANNLTTVWTVQGTGGSYRDITAPLAAGGYKFECSNKRYITNKQVISTVGYSNIRFNFCMTAESLESGEYCQAQYSTDGGTTWTVAAEIRDPNDLNTFVPKSITLPSAAENIPNLKIRFRVYGNANNDYMKVDEVFVKGDANSGTVDNPPTVEAGANKTITLPATTASLSGTATDTDATPVATSAWTVKSSPSGATAAIATPNSLTTAVSNLTVSGNYVFTLTSTDTAGNSASDEVTIIVNPLNKAPAVNAGVDVSITLPVSTVTLVGTATDSDGTIASRLWAQTSGPKTATLSGKTTNTLKISALTVAGDYVFTFTSKDNLGLASSDTAKVTVTSAVNKAPTVNAGADVSITIPVSAANLFGTAIDSDGTITSMLWTQTSGPKTATFSGQTTNNLSISDLTVEGDYVFTFTATDNSGVSASDTAKVTVLPQSPPTSDYPTFNNIPFAIGIAIDDLGWKIWTAENSKNPDNADYQTIMNVGQSVGTRVMSAWIMCDMDRSNILAKAEYNKPVALYNMSTVGIKWDNSWLVSPNDFVLMNLVKENNAYMEFGLHGVTHDHPNASNVAKNAEYALITNTLYTSTSWGWGDMDIRAKCFRDLIRQYFTADEMVFPEAFVPPAHAYYYNNNNDQSTGALLSTYGVKFVNGSTYVATTLGQGGTDHGAVFINRAEGANYNWENTATQNATPWYGGWNMFDYPNYPTDAYGWVESHFPNWWGYDAQNRWTTYLRGINNAPDRLLPKNTESCVSQWFYRRNSSIAGSDGTYTLTVNSTMPDVVYTWNLLGTLTIKTPLKGGHISSASINNGAQVVGYYEDTYDYGYLIISSPSNPIGALPKGTYTLNATLGDTTMNTYVDMGLKTFNVYGFNSSSTQATISLKMYGTQDVKVKTMFAPTAVSSDNLNLKVNSWSYSEPFITINVSGKNMNGETGTLAIN